MLTAGKDYGVRVITAYDNRRVGQVFYPPALLRDALVRSGRVERVKPPADMLDVAPDETARNRPKQGRMLTR